MRYIRKNTAIETVIEIIVALITYKLRIFSSPESDILHQNAARLSLSHASTNPSPKFPQ